jgi:hypothetical protein
VSAKSRIAVLKMIFKSRTPLLHPALLGLINQTPTIASSFFFFRDLLGLGHWNLEIGIYLEFGAWDL